MDDRLRARYRQIMAELRLLRVPAPLRLAVAYTNKNRDGINYDIDHRSGKTEKRVTSAIAVLRSCAQDANMDDILGGLGRYYKWQADADVSEDEEDAVAAPGTPVHIGVPLPEVRVTRGADRRSAAVAAAAAAGAGPSAAASLRGRRAAAPRTARGVEQVPRALVSAPRANRGNAEVAELQVHPAMLARRLLRMLYDWKALKAAKKALEEEVEQKAAAASAEWDEEMSNLSARESAPAGIAREALTRERDAAVEAVWWRHQQIAAPALRQLQQDMDEAKGRCDELEDALHASPEGRILLLMAALARAPHGSWLLRWLQRCLMTLGGLVVAALLFSVCKLGWVVFAAAKVAVVLVRVGCSVLGRLLVAAAGAAHRPGQLARCAGSLGAQLLHMLQLPAWAAPAAAAAAAAAALQRAAAGHCGRCACSSRPASAAVRPGFSRAAAASAGSAWKVTEQLEGIVLHARGYYHGQRAEPPLAAELVQVVVAVSRLVQAEFGAAQGCGECNLRDHVLRLLEGLLAVQGRRLLRAEAAMGQGRADMVLLSAAGLVSGPPLLVVEFKLLASEAGRSQRDRNAGQLRGYLQDKVAGCREGLLVTFDSCLVNGLSAVRVVGVERAAWARLLGDRPEHAPRFTCQPCPHLERCAWALGAMAGICTQHGVAVGEQAGG